ncbi:hypothetical protein LC593_31685 [Nostoc sp. CHAB 5844]|nr:hypothetical protein [Nostoc sp. CHAB 5844]
MTENKKPENFWTTVPGIVTAIAGLITAIAGLFASFNTIIGTVNGGNSSATPSPSPAVSVTPGAGSSEKSGTISIYAKNKEGIKFTNPTNKLVKIYFRPDGESLWSVGREWSSVSSKGYETPERPIGQEFLRCPEQNIGALVVQYNGNCQSVGTDITLTLEANEEILFFINELPNYYDDNRGNVPVKWRIVE